jgi:hypothetical protein
VSETNEVTFTKKLIPALGRIAGVRAWRQNCGEIPVRDAHGNVVRVFHPGPPDGAADITGGVKPEGWRLEIELKMPGEKRTQKQERWAAFCADMGFVYVLYTYSAAYSLEANLLAASDAVQDALAARRSRA